MKKKCFLWFHKWKETGNKRKCMRCGKKEKYHVYVDIDNNFTLRGVWVDD